MPVGGADHAGQHEQTIEVLQGVVIGVGSGRLSDINAPLGSKTAPVGIIVARDHTASVSLENLRDEQATGIESTNGKCLAEGRLQCADGRERVGCDSSHRRGLVTERFGDDGGTRRRQRCVA